MVPEFYYAEFYSAYNFLTSSPERPVHFATRQIGKPSAKRFLAISHASASAPAYGLWASSLGRD